MKKIISLLTVITISILLASCGDKDKAADDIMAYYNETWIPINNMKKDQFDEMNPEFNKLDSKEDKTEASAYVKEEIIPVVEEVIKKLEDVEVNNKQAKKMNKLQLKVEKFALKSFENMIKYYEGDYSEGDLRKDNKKLDSLYIDVIDYQNKVFDKYNLTKSDEEIGNFTSVEKE